MLRTGVCQFKPSGEKPAHATCKSRVRRSCPAAVAIATAASSRCTACLTTASAAAATAAQQAVGRKFHLRHRSRLACVGERQLEQRCSLLRDEEALGARVLPAMATSGATPLRDAVCNFALALGNWSGQPRRGEVTNARQRNSVAKFSAWVAFGAHCGSFATLTVAARLAAIVWPPPAVVGHRPSARCSKTSARRRRHAYRGRPPEL